MSVIVILIMASILMAGGFLTAFIWAVRSGQFDDTRTPALRVLTEESAVSRSSGSADTNQNVHAS
jgi:cbb3-type cytochrome oxidase maturation protein